MSMQCAEVRSRRLRLGVLLCLLMTLGCSTGETPRPAATASSAGPRPEAVTSPEPAFSPSPAPVASPVPSPRAPLVRRSGGPAQGFYLDCPPVENSGRCFAELETIGQQGFSRVINYAQWYGR